MKIRYFILIILAVCTGFGFNAESTIEEVIGKLLRYGEVNYQEKIYVQTDSDIYYSGEVIWLSTRLLDARTHTASIMSKVAHVKLYNAQGSVLYHKKVLTSSGVGNTDILLADSLSTGTYHLVAYTDWMRNYDQEFLFSKQIQIFNELPASDQKISKTKTDLDVGFFPEGGHLVEEMINVIGLKITNNQGIGVDKIGVILDDLGDTIVHLKTYKYGMGSFTLKPESKRAFFLVIDDNTSKKYPLPDAVKQGINLTVTLDDWENAHVEMEMSRNFSKANKKLFLISQSRGLVTFAAEGRESQRSFIDIPRQKLKAGINQITVFSQNGIPLAERLIFIAPDESQISFSSESKTFHKKSEVILNLSSQLKEGAKLSISVQDRPAISQVNIKNYLLLSSDLKGQIESPEFYFSGSDSSKIASDNLMLTQGWRRFDWIDVLDNTEVALNYPPEREAPIFRGKLIDLESGKSIHDTLIVMSVIDSIPNFYYLRLGSEEEFVFDFYQIHGEHKVFVNVIEDSKSEKYSLLNSESYDPFIFNIPENYPSVNYTQFSNHFEQKRLENQILSNYKIYRPELFSPPVPQIILDQPNFNRLTYPDHSIDPDQYIPLLDIKELVNELFPSARIRKKKGLDKIYVYAEEPDPQALERKPAVFNPEPISYFLNGVPVFDDEKIYGLEYSNIDLVDIYTGQYDIADHRFYGFMAIITKDIFSEFNVFSNAVNQVDFEGISLKRTFYQPKYQSVNQSSNRVPDLRHLLHWVPDFQVAGESTCALSFYTSDVKNDFYVHAEGVTDSGEPIVLDYKFHVSD